MTPQGAPTLFCRRRRPPTCDRSAPDYLVSTALIRVFGHPGVGRAPLRDEKAEMERATRARSGQASPIER